MARKQVQIAILSEELGVIFYTEKFTKSKRFSEKFRRVFFYAHFTIQFVDNC